MPKGRVEAMVTELDEKSTHEAAGRYLFTGIISSEDVYLDFRRAHPCPVNISSHELN